MNNLPDWVEDNKFQILLGLIGLFLMVVGVGQAIREQMATDAIVEFVDSSENEEEVGLIVVDVGGAVENPGVYEFSAGSRINDVLMAAGGLSAEADRNYISRGINLAEKVLDGAKVYIPFKDDPNNAILSSEFGGGSTSGKVSINNASAAELDSLWGVGTSRADQIIENRPYGSIDELKSKARIPANVIEANKDKMSL